MNAETLQSARNLEAFVLEQINEALRWAVSNMNAGQETGKLLWAYHKELDRRKALALEYAQGTLPDRRKTPRLTHYGHLIEIHKGEER